MEAETLVELSMVEIVSAQVLDSALQIDDIVLHNSEMFTFVTFM